MDDVRNQANNSSGLMDKLRNGATSQLDAQKERASDGVSSVARAVRQSTQQLRDSQHDTIAQYVEQAVDRVERFANELKQKDVNEIVRDAQQFARRNPAVFVGAAFGVGVVAARFFKSSAANGSSANDWRQGSGINRGSSYANRSYANPSGNYGTSGTGFGSQTPSSNPGTERF